MQHLWPRGGGLGFVGGCVGACVWVCGFGCVVCVGAVWMSCVGWLGEGPGTQTHTRTRTRQHTHIHTHTQGKEGGLTIHDYNYNAFDQEPRPYSYGV